MLLASWKSMYSTLNSHAPCSWTTCIFSTFELFKPMSNDWKTSTLQLSQCTSLWRKGVVITDLQRCWGAYLYQAWWSYFFIIFYSVGSSLHRIWIFVADCIHSTGISHCSCCQLRYNMRSITIDYTYQASSYNMDNWGCCNHSGKNCFWLTLLYFSLDSPLPLLNVDPRLYHTAFIESVKIYGKT